MPGKININPTQIVFKKGQSTFDPYVQAEFNDKTFKTHRATGNGENFQFAEGKNNLQFDVSFDPVLRFNVRDGDKKAPNDLVGDFKIDLDVLETEGTSKKWYDIYSKDKLIGQIEIQGSFEPSDKNRYQPGLQTKPNYVDTNQYVPDLRFGGHQ